MQTNVNNAAPGTVFYDESSVRQLMSILSVSSLQPDRFYLTGYETIFFETSHEFVLESLHTSVMGFVKELLIVRLSDEVSVYEQLCRRHDIGYRIIEACEGMIDFTILEERLATDCRHSHLLISGSVLNYGEHLIFKLGDLLSRYRRCLFVLKDVFQYHVDFMVANDVKSGNSVVLARRSKLVQSEGIARTPLYDLYAYWQSSMRSRRPCIEPMSA